MANRVIVLIDAGYFWVQVAHVLHGTKASRDSIQVDYAALRQEILDQTAAQFKDSELLRICWYDGPGSNGKAQSHLDIEELDDFKLKLGTRNATGNQKAVDGLIIADLISLAQSKSVSSAILMSGDADLTPGVTAAQSLGIRVHLLSIGPKSATSPILRSEVDFKVSLADSTVEKFASKAIVSASYSPSSTPSATANPTEKDLLGDVARSVFDAAGGNFSEIKLANGLLPKEVDGKLLSKARKSLGRELTEPEKRELRKRFRSFLA